MNKQLNLKNQKLGVMTISDWVVVLAQGTVIAEGTPSSIVTNRRVIDAYLGDPTEEV